MQAPIWIARFVGWRWMPSVALVVGSLAFVAVAVAIVPDDLGGVASGTERLSRAARARAATKAVSDIVESPSSGDAEETAPAAEHARAARPTARHDIVQSIFHPLPRTELPVEPVDPNPQPPPPPPPLPPPTNTIYTLDNPAPVSPNPLSGPGALTPDLANPNAVPPAPSEPQGIRGQ